MRVFCFVTLTLQKDGLPERAARVRNRFYRPPRSGLSSPQTRGGLETAFHRTKGHARVTDISLQWGSFVRPGWRNSSFFGVHAHMNSARTASPRPAANNRRRSTGSLPLEHHGARSSPAALEGPLGQVSTEDLEEAEGFAGLGVHGEVEGRPDGGNGMRGSSAGFLNCEQRLARSGKESHGCDRREEAAARRRRRGTEVDLVRQPHPQS